MKLSDIPKNTPIFWKQLGMALCTKIRMRVQKTHRNAKSERFEAYDEDYAKKKSAGEISRFGTPQASRSETPDMTLTGKTMSDLKVHTSNKDSVTLGWMDQGEIVQRLQKHKNYSIVNTSKPYFSKDEDDWIFAQINKEADKQITKYCSTPITINLGAR